MDCRVDLPAVVQYNFNESRAWTRWSTKAAALHQGVIVLWRTKGHKFPERTVFKLPAITIDSTMRQLVGQEAGEAVDAQALLDASPVEVHNEAIDKNFYVLTQWCCESRRAVE